MTKIKIPNPVLKNEWIKQVYVFELANINLPKIDSSLQYKGKPLTEIVKEICSTNLNTKISYKNKYIPGGKNLDVWATGVDTKIFDCYFIININKRAYDSALKVFLISENTYVLNYRFINFFEENKLVRSNYSYPESSGMLKIKKQLKIGFEEDKIGVIGKFINKINFIKNTMRKNYFMPDYFEIKDTEIPEIEYRKQDSFCAKNFTDLSSLCADISQQLKVDKLGVK